MIQSAQDRLSQVSRNSPQKDFAPMPIQPQLDQITADLLPTLPQPLQDLVEEGYQEILAQDLEAPAKKVGDRAPAFTLPNTEGEDRSLADTLASDMAIVVFFRGIWCPYCVAYLQALEANLSAFEAAGGQLLVITPQTREYAAKTKGGVDYPRTLTEFEGPTQMSASTSSATTATTWQQRSASRLRCPRRI